MGSEENTIPGEDWIADIGKPGDSSITIHPNYNSASKQILITVKQDGRRILCLDGNIPMLRRLGSNWEIVWPEHDPEQFTELVRMYHN